MKHTRNYLLATLVVLIGMVACDKPAGEGGTSRIKGRVYIRNYNSMFTGIPECYYAIEERIYITYGNNDFYDDDLRTSYDGTYVFDNLRKGTYTVFGYSKDSTLSTPGELYPVFKTIEITEDYQTVDVPLMILLN